MSSTAASLSTEEYDQRRQLLERIKALSKHEMDEIYTILKNTGSEFSANSNGVFFDLCKLPAEAVNQISEYIDFCNKINKDFAKREEDERKAQEALQGCDHYSES